MTVLRKILVAEDNPGDVLLIREALREHNVDCDLPVYSDGDQVIRRFQQLENRPSSEYPDLLLVDFYLPRHDGLEILDRFRRLHYCQNTPVIFMTASDSPTYRQQVERHAAVSFFRKPIDLNEFLTFGGIIEHFPNVDICDEEPSSD